MLTLCASFAMPSSAQDHYPSRPVTVVVPFAPGGPTDYFSRYVSDRLSKELGQPFVVMNKAGAGGIIGSQLVATSKPDGYTLLIGTAATHGINLPLYKSLPYHPLKDFAIVAMLNRQSFVLLASPSVPHSLKAVIDEAAADPKKFFYASAGNGTTSHLYGEILKTKAGMQMAHVPFKGSGPALQSVLAGQTHFLFESFGFAQGHLATGKVQALAVGSKKRSPLFPDVPTFAEAGLPDFYPATWCLLAAPTGTPAEIVERLNRAVNKVLSDPAVIEHLASQSFETIFDSTPQSATATVKSEIDKFTKVIDALHIKME